MTGKVFFSFESGDRSRAMVVRSSCIAHDIEPTGFRDSADFAQLQAQGDKAVAEWIDGQLEGTSVTVVLVGANTCGDRWVNYEIEKSVARGNGLLGVDISKIEDYQGKTTQRCGEIPPGYKFYLWLRHDGYTNLGAWIEAAAGAAAR
jgi:hypothetical protein